MKKIVFVEDDQIVSTIYSNRLRNEGHEVENAHDGPSGIQLIEDSRPDLVVLDLMLPKLSGVEVLKAIRSKPHFKKLPIVVFSNSYLASMVQEAWKAGATKCVSKIDSTPKQLVEIVNKLLADTPTQFLPSASPGPAPASQTQSRPYLSSDSDAVFQANLRQTFLNGAEQTVADLRNLFLAFSKSKDEIARTTSLFHLYRKVHSVTGNLSVAGMRDAALMGASIEALVKELYEKPSEINSSNMRTVAQAVDFWATLFNVPNSTNITESFSSSILVVDDELLSRKAVGYALQKAGLQSISVEDPGVALNLLAENNFDLVFLDIDMPGLNGYELCSKLRALPRHKQTPVVFVTGLNDFDSRARSSLCGGSDLIGKPFLFIELTVKALTYFFKSRLSPKPAEPSPFAAPDGPETPKGAS